MPSNNSKYTEEMRERTDVKTFFYGQNDITTPTAPSYYQSSSGLWDGYMLYNGTNTYTNMYYLNVGQTPSLDFDYYDEWDYDHEYPLSGMTETTTFDNLNTSVAGYYYQQYTATDGVYYTISFRIVFKVGTPVPYNTVPQEHLHYNYSSNWEDQLLSYGEIDYINGVPQTEVTIQQYTYDSQGNPTFITNFFYNGNTYYGASLGWSGRELSTITIMSGSSTPAYQVRYKYNDQGYRTSKAFYTFSGYVPTLTETITYELIGDKVIYETNGTNGILFAYDYDGTLISFNYDSNINDSYVGYEYFYIRNQMGDISHIVDISGNVVVHYVYDAYGNITYQTPSQTIGDINPYRYRGYRYDDELSWYYLNSRYYTPEIGRFLNSDGLLGQTGDILSHNLYGYCANNSVMNNDPSGLRYIEGAYETDGPDHQTPGIVQAGDGYLIQYIVGYEVKIIIYKNTILVYTNQCIGALENVSVDQIASGIENIYRLVGWEMPVSPERLIGEILLHYDLHQQEYIYWPYEDGYLTDWAPIYDLRTHTSIMNIGGETGLRAVADAAASKMYYLLYLLGGQ